MPALGAGDTSDALKCH